MSPESITLWILDYIMLIIDTSMNLEPLVLSVTNWRNKLVAGTEVISADTELRRKRADINEGLCYNVGRGPAHIPCMVIHLSSLEECCSYKTSDRW